MLDAGQSMMITINDTGTVRLQVRRSGGFEGASRRAVVSDVNQPPVLGEIEDMVIAEGETLSLTISATDGDNDVLGISAYGPAPTYSLPEGVNWDSPIFTWTPDSSQSGTYEITFRVQDGELNDSRTITITVEDAERLVGDFNQDSIVDFDDFFLFAEKFGLESGDRAWDSQYDLKEDGRIDFSDFFAFADNFGGSRSKLTALAEGHFNLSKVTEIRQNYPNPFNSETTISFSMAESGLVVLDIYSLTGQRVRALQYGFTKSGNHHVRWDGRDDNGVRVGSGVYVVRITKGGVGVSRKMLLVE